MKHTSYVSVAVRKTPKEALRTAISRMPQPLPISPNTKRIIIKPSIYDPNLPGNTSYGMMRAVAEFFKDVALLNIVESDNPIRSAEEAFARCNYTSINVNSMELVNLSTNPLSNVKMAGHFFDSIMIPDLLVEHDFIVNLATLKKQKGIAMSGCIKNLFGLLPQKDKAVFHNNMNELLIDLLLFFKPRLNIVDLTYLVEGSREEMKQKSIGGIVLGTDPVAVDAYCATLLGLDPMKIPYLKKAYDIGIGEALPERIQVLGTENQKEKLVELCSI